MNKIIAIKYIDALYFKENEEMNFSIFKICVVVGKIISVDTNVKIYFVEKNKKPEEGLCIPKEALILEKNHVETKFSYLDLSNKIGVNIGVYWKDIVHFINGKIPDQCTTMYTEGRLFSTTTDAIIIENPETIAVDNKKTFNHPIEKIAFIVIPKNLITNFEYYDTTV